MTTESRERLLVNWFYAHPVGHAVEALHYCLGHHLADPTREVAVVLNAASAVELAGFCPFVSHTYAVEHPLLDPCPDSSARQAGIPRRWDWILDDFRRGQDVQFAMFPGLRDYYLTSDRLLTATRARTYVCSPLPGYVPHQQLRLELPAPARAAAAARLAARFEPSGAGRIALMPAGSSERSMYPSTRSWLVILDVEACDLFLAPHTGFGMASLAVATPWLALSGGRWFEYFFNRVPFRSIIPDCERYPSFTQFAPAPVVDDDGDGPRTPSMTAARIGDDLARIVAAARELLDGSLSYEQSLRDYFSSLLEAHGGETSAIWSIDGVHVPYLPPA